MKSSHTGSLTHGKVVHALSRRVRIISPILLKYPRRACVLEILLQKWDGIEKVSNVPDKVVKQEGLLNLKASKFGLMLNSNK